MAPKYRWFTIAFILAISLDQATKAWARHALKPIYPSAMTVIDGFWEMRYSENSGAAFGLLHSVPGARYFLFVAGFFACIMVGYYLRKVPADARRIGAELGVLAGGFGNLVDRVLFGRVTDFVVWKAGSYQWPTFNVADAWLVLAVIALCFDMEPLVVSGEAKRAPTKR